MSTRRVMNSAGEASFDHGTADFSVSDAAFDHCVSAWMRQGLVAA
jgi:predicted NAD/FAD-dependent oxidoreductase